MNWMQKISQGNFLSAKFSIQTEKLGGVSIVLLCPFSEYQRWEKYKDSHGRVDRDILRNSMNEETRRKSQLRMMHYEPTCDIHISHEMSAYMPNFAPEEKTPYQEAYETDIFTKMEDESELMKNDDFRQKIKLNDLKGILESWFFMNLDGHRRITQNEISSVKGQLQDAVFTLREGLQQQFWSQMR